MKHHIMAVLLIATLCGVTCVAEAQSKLEIYPMGSADPASLKQAIGALVSDDGEVIVDEKNNRLLVVATPEEHANIGNIMKEVGKPAKNVRIDVQFRDIGTSRDTGAGLDGSGGVVITEKGVSTKFKLRPRIVNQTTETSSNTKQTLLVASGRDGSLHVGEEVPYLEWFQDYGYRYGIIHKQINWQKVGAKLLVQPTVLGDSGLIRVRITPELSGLVEGNPYHVAFQRAATEVIVQNGETIRLGGLNKDNEFYSRFLIGFDRSRSTQNLDISLTPQIMP